MFKNKIITLGILGLISISPNLSLAAIDFPAFPMSFYGQAKLNESPLAAGTEISVYCDNEIAGKIVMPENGIYGYGSPVKNKLIVSENDCSELIFKYLPQGEGGAISGDTVIKYEGVFTSGISVNKDLSFVKTVKQETSASGGGGGGGGGGRTVNDVTPPARVANFSGIWENNSVKLNWSNPRDSDFNNVLLVRSNNEFDLKLSGKNLKDFGILMHEGKKESFTDTSVENDKIYFYAITTYDLKGNYSELLVVKIKTAREESLKGENDENILVLGIEYSAETDIDYIVEETIKKEKKLLISKDAKLSKKLKGRILIQVQERGEAWYVNPADGKKYYMANGDKAYKIMRNLSVGITNENLKKIMSDKNFAKKHSGKIFLQVEEHGEAYYIDIFGEAHYLKNGSAAYDLMKNLGLGIANSDIRKIDIGEI